MSNLKYVKAPYLLNKEEVSNKPLSDVAELVKHIEETTKQIAEDLEIHAANLKLVREFLNNQNKSLSNNN